MANLNSTSLNLQPASLVDHSKPYKLNQDEFSNKPDALDSFMQPSKQQLNQIQMLSHQQQMAYISNHRAETSAVHNTSSSPGAQNRGYVYRNAPSSGGAGSKH